MSEMESRNCHNCQSTFIIEDLDIAHYARLDVPWPTRCPDCRMQRRYAHINDYVFFTRACDGCRKSMVSVYPPQSHYTVLCQDCWYSEARNDKAQGRAYDPRRPFFEQFNDLMLATPQLGIVGGNNENCDFCESVANCKNCYLISECSNCEDCYYGYWIQKCKDCIDCAYSHECENSFQLLDSFNCYNLCYSRNCTQCSESYFLEGCISCENCCCCTNLRHKQYHIFNQPYSKVEYFAALQRLGLDNPQGVAQTQRKFESFLQNQPRKHLQVENVENCSGDYVRNAKNCRNVYHCYDAEECAYGEHYWRGALHCMDSHTAGRNAELIYESTNCGIDTYNIKFSRYCWSSSNVEYSNECRSGRDLFGCVSLLPGNQYCVLNKEYDKEQYLKLVSEIKANMRRDGEYGEFFPASIALFGYNTSVAFDEWPLSKAQTLAKGWKWEHQEGTTKSKGTISMESLAPEIGAVSDSILKEVLSCLKCTRSFRVIPQELSFYRKHNIPLPRWCWDCRHRERLGLRNKKIMQTVKCKVCGVSVETTLDANKYEQILCLPCNQNLVA